MFYMKYLISNKIIVVSMVAAVLSAASICSVKAAMDVTVRDTPVVESVPAAPVVPASDFNNYGATPSAISGSPFVLVPEPGNMVAGLAGFAVLAYFLFRPGRRTRA